MYELNTNEITKTWIRIFFWKQRVWIYVSISNVLRWCSVVLVLYVVHWCNLQHLQLKLTVTYLDFYLINVFHFPVYLIEWTGRCFSAAPSGVSIANLSRRGWTLLHTDIVRHCGTWWNDTVTPLHTNWKNIWGAEGCTSYEYTWVCFCHIMQSSPLYTPKYSFVYHDTHPSFHGTPGWSE